MSETQQTAGGFKAPTAIDSTAAGAAQPPVNTGVVTKKRSTKKALESVAVASAKKEVENGKSKVRNIQVVAIQKGWFDCKRIPIGKKFTVSEQEFSEKWMEKLK